MSCPARHLEDRTQGERRLEDGRVEGPLAPGAGGGREKEHPRKAEEHKDLADR